MDDICWTPPASGPSPHLASYLDRVRADHGVDTTSYDALWTWSVTEPDAFWRSLWDHHDVAGAPPPGPALAGSGLPGAEWFPGARLSYAAEALRRLPDDAPAVIARAQGEPDRVLTGAELRDQVARCRAGLARAGVGVGDRVGAYVGNRVEAVVAFLATASLGAVWASCPPEMGPDGALGRLAQVDPTVLLVVPGYRYGAKVIDRRADVAALVAGLGPSLAEVVEIPVPGLPGDLPDATATWAELVGEPDGGEHALVPFDHPLYVLFSSGTTGPPKAIVHGHGGIVLEHLKLLGLHLDLGPGDRFTWFSTTGWMMWNVLVSGLLVGATIVLFDGDPGHPDLGELWRMADELDVTHFGTSAPFLMACRADGRTPAAEHDLSALRVVGSTGAPLPAEGFRWVSTHVGPDVMLSSISGGTDVCTAFLAGSPLLPVVAGRMACACLGARVEAWGPDGERVLDEPGELVLTAPLPSMPVGFWGDDDGTALRAAYFDERPGVWSHGDWLTEHSDGGFTISGRSDATLNRGGVRLGTAELYAVVEDDSAVSDSLVVHLDDDEPGGPGRLLLFVVLEAEAEPDAVVARLRAALRSRLSPRHVPDAVVPVEGVPRTRSGKKLEVPVKAILQGRPAEGTVARDAVDRPDLLAAYERLGRDRPWVSR
ncbi:MAG TPA: acetoacetate--CoA ligase [Iamia sp.]|nr:acetoacetate--CoA ligase [Iamia sp.]